MTAQRGKGSGLEWFVRRGATVRGPLSSTRVRHFVIEGKLGLEDEVSPDRKAWRRIADVAEVLPLQMRDHDPALDAVDSEKDAGARAWRTLLVAVLVVTGFTLAVYLAGSGEEQPVVDCAADPRPGVVLEGCRLAAVEWRSATLRGARLANASLAGAVLSGADLEDADLRYVDLGGVDLSYAVLRRAVLKGANLQLADLTNADLRGADLSFADLSRVRLGGARLDDAVLQGAIWVDGRRCTAGDCPR
jgi:hypothetical protein